MIRLLLLLSFLFPSTVFAETYSNEITWDDTLTGETEWRLEHNENGGPFTAIMTQPGNDQSSVPTLSYTQTGLAEDTTHCWRLYAKNEFDEKMTSDCRYTGLEGTMPVMRFKLQGELILTPEP